MERKVSLRARIFISMIVLTLFSLSLIVIVTYVQYNAQDEGYNTRRILRKETQVKNHLNYVFERDSSFFSWTQNPQAYRTVFQSIAAIHKVTFGLYSLSGEPLFFSYVESDAQTLGDPLPSEFLKALYQAKDQRIGQQTQQEKGKFQAAYSVLLNEENQPYALLYFPYFEDVSISTSELNIFIRRVFQISLFMLIITFSFAFLLSGFITQPIESLRDKIAKTRLLKKNDRITLEYASKEIDALVHSYNSMLDALEESAERLAKNEREQAWQEMAKQVAHEIKNPLTPMRLTVQSFQQRFDPQDHNSLQRLNDFTQTMIEQIDTMSNVASAFSDFATLPQSKIKQEDMVEITRLATEIFSSEHLELHLPDSPILWPMDRTQWIRVLTNVLQNAFQAIPAGRTPLVKVSLFVEDQKLKLMIEDNGNGIAVDDFDKVFEPRFTTKTGGMGLGLGIVKNIITSLNGTIYFDSVPEQGTTFYITLNQ